VSRVAALGLTVGARLAVLQNGGYGPILVLVRDTRGRSEALTILVEQAA
jgi:Fe2+ transport system protein FeoA